MRNAQRQSKSNLGTDDFDASVVEAAQAYHMQIGIRYAKSRTPIEVAAFITGACWARQVLESREKEADQIKRDQP
jgi:hypothetical protein